MVCHTHPSHQSSDSNSWAADNQTPGITEDHDMRIEVSGRSDEASGSGECGPEVMANTGLTYLRIDRIRCRSECW